MHDETFLVLKGTATFYSRNQKFTANMGDYIVVPPHSPHTFANEDSHEELVMYNSFTPAFYVNYFRLMAKMADKEKHENMGGKGIITPDIGKYAMGQYATIQTTGGEW